MGGGIGDEGGPKITEVVIKPKKINTTFFDE